MTTRAVIPTAVFAICALAAFALAPAAAHAAVPAGSAAAAPAQANRSAPAGASDFDAGPLADKAIGMVRERLRLTPDQVTRIRPLLADHMARIRQVLIDYSDPSGVEYPALIQAFNEQRRRFGNSLGTILDAAQMKEVEVIRKEVDQKLKETICAARLQALSARLSLKPDQEKQVGPILCDDFVRKRDLIAGLATSTGGPAAHRSVAPLFQKIQDETETRLRAALTPSQMKEYVAYRDQLKARARQTD
jgi:hypothetical protein